VDPGKLKGLMTVTTERCRLAERLLNKRKSDAKNNRRERKKVALLREKTVWETTEIEEEIKKRGCAKGGL